MPRHTLTANESLRLVASTDQDESGIAVHVDASATFGGGTLTLLRKAAGGEADATPVLLDTLTAGARFRYDAGFNTEYYLTLSGATSPSIIVYVEKVR